MFILLMFIVQELKGGKKPPFQSDSELGPAHSQGGRPLHGVLAQTVPFLLNVGDAKQKAKESVCKDLTSC